MTTATNSTARHTRRWVAALLWAAAAVASLADFGKAAHAALVPFQASVDGVSQIVEVLDPTGPVVRVQTLAFGTGSPGALIYRSGDGINLSTGQGTGQNRFTTDTGDELFGSFTVQMLPGADASLFSLVGQMLFSGGTGSFLGATGTATFLGTGQFFSPSEAGTRFVFEGEVFTVSLPPAASLLGLGLCLLLGRSAFGRRQTTATASTSISTPWFSVGTGTTARAGLAAPAHWA